MVCNLRIENLVSWYVITYNISNLKHRNKFTIDIGLADEINQLQPTYLDVKVSWEVSYVSCSNVCYDLTYVVMMFSSRHETKLLLLMFSSIKT